MTLPVARRAEAQRRRVHLCGYGLLPAVGGVLLGVSLFMVRRFRNRSIDLVEAIALHDTKLSLWDS
ncbi:hypothetical protein [Devosia marina]|uniref:Uncharacterized protein n=1 Tax=Devosia marina TaxID=2683198 RepID=A0A7X3K453_9HYPH|nr:hypothetical protein [Devosia marina]MVT00238.1 hypothetical protein [Devosia marina]